MFAPFVAAVRVTRILIYLMCRLREKEKKEEHTINLLKKRFIISILCQPTYNNTLTLNKHTPQHHKKEEKQEAEGKV